MHQITVIQSLSTNSLNSIGGQTIETNTYELFFILTKLNRRSICCRMDFFVGSEWIISLALWLYEPSIARYFVYTNRFNFRFKFKLTGFGGCGGFTVDFDLVDDIFLSVFSSFNSKTNYYFHKHSRKPDSFSLRDLIH